MFRAASLAFALAFIPASASAQARYVLQLPEGWECIKMQGWALQDVDEVVLIFTMPDRQPMHMWFRYELSMELGGMRSWDNLVQFDCNGGRTRTLKETYFVMNNLEGVLVSLDETQPWEVPEIHTRHELALVLLCD
jgi:hypothetical protein